MRGESSRKLLDVLLLAMLFPFAASADEALGFKIGDGRLHPFLQVDGRFDSAAGFFGSPATLKPDLIVHARPGLRFGLDNPSTLVAFDGSAEYLFYTGILGPETRSLSRLHAHVGLDARFNRDGAVEFQIGDTMSRSDRPRNPAVGIGVVSLFNDVKVAVPFHPGGRALEITPHGSWQVEFFQPLAGAASGCTTQDITCNPALLSQMNYSNVNFGLDGKWKFLPKTALLLQSSFDMLSYFTPSTQAKGANVLRVQAGLAGLVTPHLTVTALAGYGGDFAGSNLHTVIGNADITYVPFENSRFSLGYIRLASPVAVFGTYVGDTGYLRTSIGTQNKRVTFKADGSVGYLRYTSVNNRNDLVVAVGAGPSFMVAQWFDINAMYNLSYRTSTGNIASINFTRHEATLRFDFHY